MEEKDKIVNINPLTNSSIITPTIGLPKKSSKISPHISLSLKEVSDLPLLNYIHSCLSNKLFRTHSYSHAHHPQTQEIISLELLWEGIVSHNDL